jgi:2,4-dienoyl-CoA reductase-like NADH-dependent reductase (Old Yellow Enzyme family)
MPTLFDPIDYGAIRAPNRIVMSPLTRGRATPDGVPTAIMADYYRQRASAGLIISEATGISREGLGWPTAPGAWNDAQTEGWKPVTEAVHKAGGRIVLQLWHMGRLVHPDFLDGELPVSSSDRKAPGGQRTPKSEGKRADYVAPRPLRLDEIPRVVGDYARAARNAMKAGFDGVEVHGANGYLIDQFLRDNTNFRDDAYGGPIANRVRFMCEVMDAVIAEAGADRTGIRLSPNGDTQGCDDSQPVALFTTAAKELAARGIAFLDLREQGPDGTFGRSDVPKVSPDIRKVFPGPLVLNGDYSAEGAKAAVEGGACDGIAFGRPYISNPDLVERVRNGWPLAPDNMKTWYSPGPEGYTDYPAYAA